jgi:hypothetical protein
MTLSRSYTFATPNASSQGGTNSIAIKRWRTAWFVIFLLGITLRLLRLNWQPLWWDEGYSIYFATEPLTTMLSLTARDIHPPFYYALLHFWLQLTNSTGPVAARLLSVLIGIATMPVMTWATQTLLPTRRWLPLITTLLFAISPMHLFYSQEVRMYGLALLLTLCASTFLWKIQQALEQGDKPYRPTAAYILTAALALLTLYYTGFILLAHQLWTLYLFRKQWRKYRWFLAAALLVLLIQLPWWLYALPKLFAYVADKVTSDQDLPLPIWDYLWRHWLAFFAGHIPTTLPWLEVARRVISALILIPLLLSTRMAKLRSECPQHNRLLWIILPPLLMAFLVNLRLPFFPEGGERLLLQILPYILLLSVLLIGKISDGYPRFAAIALSLPLLSASIGTIIFFSTPRYVEHDYRPIIDHVVEHSRPNDTILALFPWQVGYWRAYSPHTPDGGLLPPQPKEVDQQILVWNPTFAASLDQSLTEGTIWFPMPLSFGSTLPLEIEEHLQKRARSLENSWFSTATRLSAWTELEDPPQPQPIEAVYPDLRLASGSVAPSTAPSANTPLAINLCWQPSTERADLRATLRLLDANGDEWGQRDLNPLAAHTDTPNAQGDPCLERIAFAIPVGLPPATYQLVIGVGPKEGEQLFTPLSTAALPTAEWAPVASPLIPLAQITVTAPTEAISPQRLPMDFWLHPPAEDAGLHLLGFAGINSDTVLLAGDELKLTLALQSNADQPAERHLYISLLDRQGNGIAGWEGWPLPSYPTNTWIKGALAQVPIQFYLPPDLAAGRYALTAGFLDPQTGAKAPPKTLTQVEVVRRPTSFDPPISQSPIAPPVQFGTHAELIGYSFTQEGSTIYLALDWKLLHPLLPPHHIFAHLFDASGERIAQTDGVPTTADGRAPTGSWLPGEYLTTQQIFTLPSDIQGPITVQTGLYLPTTGERLLTTVEGTPIGNSVTLQLQIAP